MAKKVISKNKKRPNKEGAMKRIVSNGSTKRNIIIFVSLFIILGFVFLLFVLNNDSNEKIISINGTEYTKEDFMIYFYSAKYEYFDGNIENLKDSDYDVLVDEDNNTTVRDYLKDTTISDIKTAQAITDIAKKYNISLNKDDLKEVDRIKDDFIVSLGGDEEYQQFLKDNKTCEEAYIKMIKVNYLYEKILDEVYSENKINDLTDEEKKQAKEDYESNYIKIKQIILLIVDLDTSKSLSTEEVNNKKDLANTILNKIDNGEDFDSLIERYNESSNDLDESNEEYYNQGELLEELEEAVLDLDTNQVSGIIKTKYAFHIIKRLELDDAKLEDYYEELRKDKYLEELEEYLDDQKVLYHNAYDKIKIR